MAVCASCGTGLAQRAKFCPECGAPRPVPTVTSESRRLVTILFSDIVGSTTLGEGFDAETVRALLQRYFIAVREIIERHGGTVEKFIGDAVMAVFGVPAVREDDALRAVRAASEMRAALVGVNRAQANVGGPQIQARVGLASGEVVAGDPATGQSFVTGDTVNTAARLQQAAEPGEILLARATWLLVRDSVEAAPRDPVAARGKSRPVDAFRLGTVVRPSLSHTNRPPSPFVGRERELAGLRTRCQAAFVSRRPELVLVVGAAGVGKSRVIDELVAATPATLVLRGRCLPYGEGTTYRPLADVLRAAADSVRSSRLTA